MQENMLQVSEIAQIDLAAETQLEGDNNAEAASGDGTQAGGDDKEAEAAGGDKQAGGSEEDHATLGTIFCAL